MTNEHMEQVLLEALDLLEAGHSMEAVLQQYPAEADELRPYLLTVQQLVELAPQPQAAAQQASQQAFLATAKQPTSQSQPAARRTNLWGWLLRPVLALLALAFLGTSVVVAASGQAIPGDTLYSVKRLVEESRLALSPDPDQLRDTLREERLREVQRLLALDRQGTVTFTGTLELITADQWTVAGVTVVILPETVVEGDALTGRAVEVTGQTGSGVIIAERIVVIGGSPARPEPAPVFTATPEATPTRSPTSTPRVTPQPAATSVGGSDDGNIGDDDDDNDKDDDDDNPTGDDDDDNSNDDDNDDSDAGDDGSSDDGDSDNNDGDNTSDDGSDGSGSSDGDDDTDDDNGDANDSDDDDDDDDDEDEDED
jgi:hypothetical protein